MGFHGNDEAVLVSVMGRQVPEYSGVCWVLLLLLVALHFLLLWCGVLVWAFCWVFFERDD